MHAETQAGTPTACAAMLAVLEEMSRLDAVNCGRRVARRLDAGLRRLESDLPWATGVSGVGCFRGLGLTHPDGRCLSRVEVQDAVSATLAEGAIVHSGPSGVQLIPSLMATDVEIDDLLSRLRRGIQRFFTDVGR